jgi:signal transduction histidine kinase
MLNNKKLFILVLFLYCIVLSISFSVIDWIKENRINVILDTHMQNSKTYYDVLMYHERLTADVIYKETIENQWLMNLLSDAKDAHDLNETKILSLIREKTIKLLENKYGSYKMLGVLQYHFVFPDNHVFLRMHKLNKFGDDLSGIRSDFEKVNKTLKLVRGFAQGRTSHAFRNVYPLILNNKHLGAIEISFSSELLQNYFTDVNKIHTHFLVRKDIFKSHAWTRDDLILKYQPSAEHENYMITMTKEHSIAKCIVENKKSFKNKLDLIHKKMDENLPFALFLENNNQARVSSFYPISHNTSNEVVAWVVTFVHDKLIDKLLYLAILFKTFLTLIWLIVFGFIYYLLNQKLTLSLMVREKTKHLVSMNSELHDKKNELQNINKNLETKIKEEVEKSRKKDKILFEQSKLASLGEMIGNIAHQWRQPLSLISTAATSVLFYKEMNKLDDKQITTQMTLINDQSQYLSKTIDDFTNFIKNEENFNDISIKEVVKSALNLVEASFHNNYIKFETNLINDLRINGSKNELEQALINIFNNAKDILKEKDEEDRIIKIKTYLENDNQIILTIQDSGGGVPEDIIEHIFEPYFTTKHQSQGTGLGLSMVDKIIRERHHQTVYVENKQFEYNFKNYTGACFTIIFNNGESLVS